MLWHFISILQSSIKTPFFLVTLYFRLISILQSSIKTLQDLQGFQRLCSISILQSSIKTTQPQKKQRQNPFQFYKVRLKQETFWDNVETIRYFNSTKFD